MQITTESAANLTSSPPKSELKNAAQESSIHFSPVGHSRTESGSSFSSTSSSENEDSKTSAGLNKDFEKINLDDTASPNTHLTSLPSSATELSSPPASRPYKSPFLLSCPRPYSASNTSTSSSIVSSMHYSPPKASPDRDVDRATDLPANQVVTDLSVGSPGDSSPPDKPHLPPKPTLSPQQQQHIASQNKSRQVCDQQESKA